MSPWWIQEVRWETTGCSVQHGRELRQLDRYLRKLACGATPKDDLFDRITTHFCIRIGVELDDLSRWRRQFSQRRVTTPNPNLLSRMERRSSVNVTHGWIVSLFSRERDGFQMESRELGRSLLRQIRDMAERYERKGALTFGFVDADGNRLLDVNPEREVAFSLVALGHISDLAQQPPSKLSAPHLETVPLSRKEAEYP